MTKITRLEAKIWAIWMAKSFLEGWLGALGGATVAGLTILVHRLLTWWLVSQPPVH